MIYFVISSSLVGATTVAQEKGQEKYDDDLMLEEVIVTAQRRSENLQKVPIAISVFSADMIDNSGVKELRDLGEYIPNVYIDQGADISAQIRIRGVGAGENNIGFDSRVGVYLDGVYLGQGPAFNQDLVDLDHIEVLRGPQGTLFGKNTIAGAISMISVKPDSEFSVDVSVNAGNYDFLELKGVVNIPMGDIFSTRISVSDRSRDGWVKNVWDPSHVPAYVNLVIEDIGPVFGIPLCDFPGATTPAGCVLWAVGPDEEPNTKRKLNNVDTRSYRAQLRIQPDDKWDINIAVDGLKSDRRALYGKSLTDSFGSTIDRFAPNFSEISFSKDSAETRDVFGTSLNIDYVFGNGYSLRSITAYRDTEFNIVNDTDTSALDFFYIDYTDRYKQKTQEFQIISPDDTNFNYVTGLYYYNQDSTTMREGIVGNAGWLAGLLPGSGASNDGEVKTESWAVFMNGSYDFSAGWRLGFGFRYSNETKDVVYHLDGTRSSGFGIGTTPPAGYLDSDTYTNFSPLLTLSYALGDNTNVYAKYSTGFNSGGFNLDFVSQEDLDGGLSFDEETADSYELGWKGTYLEGRLSINTAAFITNYQDYQVFQFFDLGFNEETGTQLTELRITNASEVDTHGLEIEVVFNATAKLTFRGSLGLLDATFADFPDGTTIEIPNPDGGAPVKVPVNAKGNELPLAPSLTASFGLQHYTRFESMNLLVSLDVLHTGEYFTTIENEKVRNLTGTHPATFTLDLPSYNIPHTVDFGRVNAITTLNGRIGLIDGNGSWEVYLWGRNLTDEDEYLNYIPSFFGSLSATPMTPRTYGVQVTFHF